MPYAAGGPWDVTLRVLLKTAGDKYSRNYVVENRPGANTIVGATACKNAAPDGHTICLLSMSSMMLNPLQHKDLSYDPEADFAPVTKIAYVDHVIIMNRSVPFTTAEGAGRIFEGQSRQAELRVERRRRRRASAARMDQSEDRCKDRATFRSRAWHPQ